MSTPRLPTYFISHGGGPWPYLTGEFRRNFNKLENSLKEMRSELQELPKAILVISGHWESEGISISSGAKPGMVYDYYGFPEYLYHIQYGAPGSPALAKRIHELLRSNDIRSQLDPTRGLDHGTFSIMKPLYPGEDIPVVQLSLDAGLDPMLHIAVGRALAPLRDEGVLIIGSGLSYHNLQEIRGTSGREASRKFDSWLQQTLVHASPEARVEQLQEWQKAPSAQAAHPREEHLIPLMVVVGAAESEPGAVTYHQDDLFGAITASSFRFGLAPGGSPSAGEMQ